MPSPPFPETSVSPASPDPTVLPVPESMADPGDRVRDRDGPCRVRAHPVAGDRVPVRGHARDPHAVRRIARQQIRTLREARASDQIVRRARDPHAVASVRQCGAAGEVGSDVVALDRVSAARLEQNPVAVGRRKRRDETVDHQARHRRPARRDPQPVRAEARIRSIDLDDRRSAVARLRRPVDDHRIRNRRQRRARLDRPLPRPDPETDRVRPRRRVRREDRLAQRTVRGIAHSVVEVVRRIDGERRGLGGGRQGANRRRPRVPGKGAFRSECGSPGDCDRPGVVSCPIWPSTRRPHEHPGPPRGRLPLTPSASSASASPETRSHHSAASSRACAGYPPAGADSSVLREVSGHREHSPAARDAGAMRLPLFDGKRALELIRYGVRPYSGRVGDLVGAVAGQEASTVLFSTRGDILAANIATQPTREGPAEYFEIRFVGARPRAAPDRSVEASARRETRSPPGPLHEPRTATCSNDPADEIDVLVLSRRRRQKGPAARKR